MNQPNPLYPPFDPSPDFVQLEQRIIDRWSQEKTFEASVSERAAVDAQGKNNEYVFYDGPPFANGLPHHGHLLTGFVKDLFARYHTMKGQRVERRFGWDCHGLPAEMEAEKELKISGRKNIVNYGIQNFNDYCRSSVMKYAGEWRYYVNRQGRWVDFDNDYKTMDTPYMESVIWAFSELYKKGYVYEGFKVMPYSWAAETVLSSSEIRLDDATREKEDKAITVAFKLKQKPQGAPEADAYYLLAWTTTPWTLPSNLALAVSGGMEYVTLRIQNNCYIVANGAHGVIEQALALQMRTAMEKIEQGGQGVGYGSPLLGADLIGLTYEPLFPYFAQTPNAFRILDGSDFIEQGSGTGVVHMAPGFGEDDYRVCSAAGIETIVPVDGEGRYMDAIFDLPNVCFHADGSIETARCILRRPTAADEAAYIALHTDPAVMDTVNDGLMTPQEAKADFAATLAHFDMHGFGQFAVFHKETNEFMGRAGLSSVSQSADMTSDPVIRCALKKAYWHGGYGRELCHATMLDGFENHGANAIIGGTLPHNPRAHDMLISLGMRYVKDVMFKRMEGKYYEVTREEFLAANPPLSLKGLNVIKETKGQHVDEPYKPEQLEKYGLANLRIIQWLKAKGQLIKQEDYKHNYPHCWRTDQPIIYKAMSSWFVDVPKFRDRMVELNQEINWIPAHIKDGRFGKWLENAREWSISRSRFWGSPIPVWRSPSGKIKVFGSIAELEAASGQTITDLHRPMIDEVVIQDGGEEFRRVEDVFDCWFESGSMPYAQVHYPFENKEWFDAHFPADFIVEYEAQTRGWFYNMMVLSVALFDRIPFKNCICHGVVLDDSGRKLSKRLKNYMDPKELFNTYGSDALRWFMMSSAIMRGSELLLDAQGKFIHDAVRLYIKPIWNACHFFTLYANADGVKAEFDLSSTHLMDRYILAKCRNMVESVEKSLDEYDTPNATQAVTLFIETLNNWYIRRNKDRFWNESGEASDQAAYNTLYSVLHIISRTIAPLLPMLAEVIYTTLTQERSVHLANWPDVSAISDGSVKQSSSLLNQAMPKVRLELTNNQIIHFMDIARDTCNAALSIRNTENIRVRQPLEKLIYYGSGNVRNSFFEEIIKDEINVHHVLWKNREEVNDIAEYKLKLNPPVLGKRLPEKMKQMIPASKKGEWELQDGQLVICGEALLPSEYELNLEPKSGIRGAQALASNDALVVLDLAITPELEAEGTARDVVRMIQQARKEANLNVSDRIELLFEGDEKVLSAVEAHKDYFSLQTLAVKIGTGAALDLVHHTQQQLDGKPLTIGFSVAA